MGNWKNITILVVIIVAGLADIKFREIKPKSIDKKAEDLADAIIKVIKHKVKIEQSNGKTIAYGQIILKKEPKNNNKLEVMAGASDRIYLGYEIVPLDRSVSNPTGGWAKVYGYVGVKDAYGFHPLEDILVEAWDIDGDGTEDPLGSARTDSAGFFEISFDNTDGWLGAYGNQDVFLRMYLDTSYAVIQRSGSTYYVRMYDDHSEVPDDTAVSIYLSDEGGQAGQYDIDQEYYHVSASSGKSVRYILEETLVVRNVDTDANGNYYVSNPNPAGAALVLWYIQEAVKFMQATVGITPNPITVEFSDQYESMYYDDNANILYVSGVEDYKDWEDMSLVLKEYAKYLLKQYSVLSPSMGFDWSAHKNQQTAWVEGFGAFFGSAVKQYAGMTSPYIYDDYPNTYNLETQYDSDYSVNDADICGAVAGILWDLYDTVNDDQAGDGVGDYYSIPFSYIWGVVDNDNPTTIYEFWNGLKNRYSVNGTKVWEIYWEHGVNIDTSPPTAPSITGYNPTTDVWVSQNWITVTWSASSDDMSGIRRYLVIVYKDGVYYNTYNAGTSTTYNVTNLPTGNYDIIIRAEDRAGNTADSLQEGPFKLDVSNPWYQNAGPTGTIYDNKTDDIVLTINWFDEGGGISVVKFRYKYEGWVDYTSWLDPTSNTGNTYTYAISVTEWKQHIGEHLYWESYAQDVAGNIVYTVTYSIFIDDDDKLGPSISNIETAGDIYDNSTEYYIRAQVTDASGVASVEIVWRFEDGSWNYWDATNIGGDIWEITIDKSNWETTELWNGRTELRIYYYIVATDGDNDRPNDDMTSNYGSKTSPIYAGKIYDDDPDPPSVVSIITTGNIYDNYTEGFNISVVLSDASGVASVKIYWSYDNSSWDERDATLGVKAWYIIIARSEWSNAPEWQYSDEITIYYYIWAIDNDNDRVYDQSQMQTNPSIAGTITDDDPNPPSITPYTSGIIYDNTSRPYYINATITDYSGLIYVLFRWSFDQELWYEWTPNNTGNFYWIEIDKSLWASEDLWMNRTYISIYYQIIATDADNDRIYDSKTRTTQIAEAGKIYDDDTDPPTISNIVTSGIIYDNHTGVFYINATITDRSGLYNVTFYWRFEDLEWNEWTPTRVENTDIYYIAIDKSIWGSTSAWEGRTYITIYYYIVAWDSDQDRAHDQLSTETSISEAGKIYDDDTTKPSIQSVTTTGNIYDNYTDAFYINATIIDQSGLSNVTIKWSIDNNTWHSWRANYTNGVYWIAISKSLWAASDVWEGATFITIYYQIIAVDNDFDRPSDELSTISPIDIAGNIYDDDTEPPQIYNTVTSGIMYDNATSPFYINVTIIDESGLSNVTIRWSINNMTWYSWEAQQDGNVYYIAIDRSIWSSSEYWGKGDYITIYYYVIAIDADDDRHDDSLSTITDMSEAGKIYDDDPNPPSIEDVVTTGVIYDNYTGPFFINITLIDDSGIYNATIYYSFDNNTFYSLSPNVEGNVYWISISKEIWSTTSAWEGSNYITIYYYVVAYDNDDDRGDMDRSKLVSNIGDAGKIFDDDTTSPQITSISYTGNDTGFVYDNYMGDIYINATITDESGIWNVTFYWRFNNGSWYQWDPYVEGDNYYIIIERSLWASAQEWEQYQITIYYRIVVWDADIDRLDDQLYTDTGEMQGPIIYDDDTNAPSISQITYTGNDTGMIYDYYQGAIYINATITDESGIDNVTFYWRFNDGEWNAWTPNNEGDLYWIAIPRDVWAQSPYWYSTNLTIYYRIVVWDADMDRPNDQLMSDTGVHPGPVIVDDDDDAPQITSVSFTGNDTGMIYDNYLGGIYINVTVYDESGVDNVTIWWRFNDGEWNAWTASYDEENDVYWISISRSLWTSTDYWYSTNLTIYYRIVVWDADMDRPNDQLMSDTGVHPGPVIMDDDILPPIIANITTTGVVNDSYMGGFYINCSVSDESGVYRVVIMWRLGENGSWFNSTVENVGGVYWTIIPRSIWASSTEWQYSSVLVIYYRIIAEDADDDRPNDRLSADTGVHQAGMIVDDDSNGPLINNIYFIDMDNDGYLESDETFRIAVDAWDASGIKNITICVYHNGSLIHVYVLGKDIIVQGGVYVTLDIGPLPSGELLVVVCAEDADNDRDKYDISYSYANITFDIELEEIYLTISPMNIHVNYSELLALRIYVEDSDGSYGISTVPVLVRIYNDNGTAYEKGFVIQLYNESEIMIVVNMTAGVWNLEVRAGDLRHFDICSIDTNIYVHEDTHVCILLDYDQLVQYENLTIAASLISESGLPLSNRNISFYIGQDDDWFPIGTASTNSSGIAVWQWFVNVSVGEHYLMAVYLGEDYYFSSENITLIKIVESEATIDISSANDTMVCRYSDPLNISVRLYNWRTGQPIIGEVVYMYILTDSGPVCIGHGTTDSMGIAFIYNSSIDVPPGVYTVVVRWLGNDYYSPTRTSFTLVVDKEYIGNINIALSPQNVSYSDTITIRIYVIDDDGEPVSYIGAEVIIYEEGSPVDELIVDIVNGSADVTWDVLGISYAPQILRVLVKIEGNKYYYGKNAEAEIQVVRENIIVSVEIDEPVFVGEETKILIHVTDDEGVPIDSVDVKVYIDDILYKDDFVINGELEVDWTPSRKGKITIRIVVAEDNPKYMCQEIEKEIEVSERKVPMMLQRIIPALAMTISAIIIFVYVKKRRKKIDIEEISENAEEAIEESVANDDVLDVLEDLE